MKKIKNLKSGEVFDGEFWIAKIEDGKRKLEAEINTQEDLDDYELLDEEELPFEEVAMPNQELQLYVGSRDEFATRDGLKQKSVLRIADRDYYEILPDGTKKTEFTWDEAMEIEKKTHGKWRVPTQAEWFAIAAAFGRCDDGKNTGKTLAKNLNLTDDGIGDGSYWSSTTFATSFARCLSFGSTNVYPQSTSDKAEGLTVRCVAGEGE